ncbi:MAG: lipoyl synthase [Gammaproteobacteria bacterium]|nr:lipoyl synthase [Gammaproteobacteria bacterium]
MTNSDYTAPSRLTVEKHKRGYDKLAKIPVRIQSTENPMHKPEWIRARIHASPEVQRIKKLLREMNLHSVCEEANCPNLGECFDKGTATFMIMGDICTRRCPFCDVAHGRPDPLDQNEPQNLAAAIKQMRLRYVVVTSVDRDDLRDGGAGHYVECIRAIRESCPEIRIEILVPDFRNKMEKAMDCFEQYLPDVFNHNLETVPRLYRAARPGAIYEWSLDLLKEFKRRHPQILTKSGLMLGIGEEIDEVQQVMRDLREHDVEMLTLGQYLQPSKHHLPVKRFLPPLEFDHLAELGYEMGFSHIASGPMVRSSYHADQQAANLL